MTGHRRLVAVETAAGFFLAVLVVLAIVAPLITPHDPWDSVGAPFEPPFQGGFVLGTDVLGRDMLSELIVGIRASLLVGALATVVPIAFGVLVGALAGYLGGRADSLLMRLTEFFQTIPSFLFALILVAIFEPSLWSTIAAISVVSWPPVARLARGQFMALRGREFVEAARIAGHSAGHVIWREILPNALPPIVVIGSLMIANAILLESAIGFLGLGDPNLMSWGYLLSGGRTSLRSAWWLAVFPGIAITLTVLAINMVGDALNDALDPRERSRRA
jgi:peptide/nickel transport system permease protein